METKFKITIPKPCHEDWNAMTPEETGRFCSSCTKTVVDFSKMKTPEIQEYFVQNKEKKICGRFKNEQINRISIPIPKSVLMQKMSFHKAFLLTLFIAMGSTLFSCKNHNDDFVTGEPVVVEDTISNNEEHLTGDTIKTETYLKGDISLKDYDSLVRKGVLPPPPPPTNKVKFIKPKSQNKLNNQNEVMVDTVSNTDSKVIKKK